MERETLRKTSVKEFFGLFREQVSPEAEVLPPSDLPRTLAALRTHHQRLLGLGTALATDNAERSKREQVRTFTGKIRMEKHRRKRRNEMILTQHW